VPNDVLETQNSVDVAYSEISAKLHWVTANNDIVLDFALLCVCVSNLVGDGAW
jgi:hypothetical protein